MKGCRRNGAVCSLASLWVAAGLLVGLRVIDAEAGEPTFILATEPAEANLIQLKLLILAQGDEALSAAAIRLQFGEAGAFLELPAPGPRTLTVSVPSGGQEAVVPCGCISLDPPIPDRVPVWGASAGGRAQLLGVLVRTPAGTHLERTCPHLGADEVAVQAVASCHFPGPDQVMVKVAYLNCGADSDRDYWAFLHVEPEAEGENLAVAAAAGVNPSAYATDTSAWRPDEVTVLSFGPYSLSRELPPVVFLRVGLYDRDGNGHRLSLAGCGEKQRTLVGRFVAGQEGWHFERLGPAGEVRQ